MQPLPSSASLQYGVSLSKSQNLRSQHFCSFKFNTHTKRQKRPMATYHHHHNNNHHNKRGGQVNFPDDVVSFRLVCPASIASRLIGSSDSVISGIRSETGCRIDCQEAVPGSDHRVILVVGSGSVDRRIAFCENDVVAEGGEVSSTQMAVVRAFELIWEAEAEAEAVAEGDDVAYCGLLANTTKIGAVVGKRGRNVRRMRRESGAGITMLPPPTCAANDDELIQITGAILAVKKALVAVTACLQDLSLKAVIFNRPVEKVNYSSASEFHSSSAEMDRDPGRDKKGTKQVSLRMLVSDRAASGIIGKRGAIVRSLQDASGALISFAAPLTKSGERVVTISARENLDASHSPVQNAAVLVFARSVEVEGQQGLSSGAKKVTARVLVGADFVGYLTGNRSSVGLEMSDVTGTDIKLLRWEQLLDCPAQSDLVVQITGEYKNVQNALSEVAGRLRHNLLSSEVLNEVRLRRPTGMVGGTAPHRMHQSVARKRSQMLETKGRHATPTIDGKSGSRMFGGSLELDKSVVHLLSSEVIDEVGARSFFEGRGHTTAAVLQQPSGQSLDSDEDNMLMEGLSQLGLSDNVSGPSTLQPPKTEGRRCRTPTTEGERSSITSAGSVELESGNASFLVAKTTLNIIVGEHLLESVFGEDGGHLARLKEISGAEVEVCKPCLGKSGMVVISGTPDQTRAAQHLLQAFAMT